MTESLEPPLHKHVVVDVDLEAIENKNNNIQHKSPIHSNIPFGIQIENFKFSNSRKPVLQTLQNSITFPNEFTNSGKSHVETDNNVVTANTEKEQISNKTSVRLIVQKPSQKLDPPFRESLSNTEHEITINRKNNVNRRDTDSKNEMIINSKNTVTNNLSDGESSKKVENSPIATSFFDIYWSTDKKKRGEISEKKVGDNPVVLNSNNNVEFVRSRQHFNTKNEESRLINSHKNNKMSNVLSNSHSSFNENSSSFVNKFNENDRITIAKDSLKPSQFSYHSSTEITEPIRNQLTLSGTTKTKFIDRYLPPSTLQPLKTSVISQEYLPPNREINNIYLPPDQEVINTYLSPTKKVNNEYLPTKQEINNVYLPPSTTTTNLQMLSRQTSTTPIRIINNYIPPSTTPRPRVINNYIPPSTTPRPRVINNYIPPSSTPRPRVINNYIPPSSTPRPRVINNYIPPPTSPKPRVINNYIPPPTTPRPRVINNYLPPSTSPRPRVINNYIPPSSTPRPRVINNYIPPSTSPRPRVINNYIPPSSTPRPRVINNYIPPSTIQRTRGNEQYALLTPKLNVDYQTPLTASKPRFDEKNFVQEQRIYNSYQPPSVKVINSLQREKGNKINAITSDFETSGEYSSYSSYSRNSLFVDTRPFNTESLVVGSASENERKRNENALLNRKNNNILSRLSEKDFAMISNVHEPGKHRDKSDEIIGECSVNRDCKYEEICLHGSCQNACSITSGRCIGKSMCQTVQHVPSCLCPRRYIAVTLRHNGIEEYDCELMQQGDNIRSKGKNLISMRFEGHPSTLRCRFYQRGLHVATFNFIQSF